MEVRDFLEKRARAAVAAAMVRGRARLWFGLCGFRWVAGTLEMEERESESQRVRGEWKWKCGFGLGLGRWVFFCGLWAFGLVSLGWVNTNVFEWVWILGLEKTEVFNKVSLIQTQHVP